jgi:uncharacterized membrane protein YedE/YeeE
LHSFHHAGAAAGALLLFNGDIFGASGVLSTIVLYPKKTLTDPFQLYKPALIAAFFATIPLFLNGQKFAKDPALESSANLPITTPLAQAMGGLLIGIGTRLANGCTTG